MVSASELQHTRLKGEKVFQDFCLKLVRRYWNDDYAQAHGRRGQGQHGVDISGSDNRSGYQNAGLQCKGAESDDPRQLTEAELIGEVEKAKGFTPKLDILIVAYAGKADAVLQKKAIELDGEHRRAGLFQVKLWSWDDIVERAASFPDVIGDLLVRNGVPAASTLDPKRPKSDKATALNEVKQALSNFEASYFEDGPAASNDDPVSNAKIDIWRDQIRSGHAQVALGPLKTFADGLPAGSPSRIRFRAYANLGAALTQAGQFEAAAIAFDEAVAAEPDTAEGRAYAARAAFLRQQEDKAYAEADASLSLNGEQVLAAVILVEAARTDVTTVGLEARLQGVVHEFDVAWALSRRYSMDGHHDDALRVARAIPDSPENWGRGIAIGEAILGHFEQDLLVRMGAPIDQEAQALLEEACDLLTTGWGLVRGRDDKKNWLHVALNLGTVHRLQGDDDRGDALALEVLGLAPEKKEARQRAALAHQRSGHLAKAVELANAVAENGSSEDALFAASMAASSKEWATVEKWATRAFSLSKTEDEKARSAELLVAACSKTSDARTALTMAAEFRPKFAASVTFESRAAELARRAGDEAALAEARARLESFEVSALTPISRFELADAYADDGRWSEASDLLEGLHAIDRPSEILHRRLFALHRADRRAEARALYESLSGSAVESKEVQRLGAAIYERSGLLAQALAALKIAMRLDPKDLRSRLDWARLCIRHDDEKSVVKWIKRAPIDYRAEPADLLEFCQLMNRCGRRKDALALAYQTLRRSWGSSETVHMRYMSLFLMNSRTDRSLKSKTVEEDFVVYLEDERGARAHYRIEATDEPSSEVLSPNHPFALDLIGAKVGETRTPSQGIGEQPKWKVVEIKHKYLELLHRAMTSHNTTFPGSRSLGMFHIDLAKDDRFEPMFEQARERARMVEETVRQYSEMPIPIDTLGQILGSDAIDASLGLRFTSDVRIDSCIGSAQERAHAVNGLTNATAVIVDALTLALWEEIGLLSHLIEQGDISIEIVQGTMDTLAERAETAREAVKQEGGSIEARGDRIAYITPTRNALKANAERWTSFSEKVRKATKIVPSESAPQADDRLEEFLSPGSIGTLATAAHSQKALLCECRRMRMLGREMGVDRSAWTQPFLMARLECGKLSHDKYIEFIANLYRQRIGFVSASGDDLHAAARNGQKENFGALADALSKPTVEPLSLISVLARFIVVAWHDPALIGERQSLTGTLFDLVISKRPADGLKIFRVAITQARADIQQLPLSQLLLASFDDYVVGFVRGHFLMDAIRNS